jgi:hypothetical protein
VTTFTGIQGPRVSQDSRRLLLGRFLLSVCLNLKIKAVRYSETSVNFYRLHGVKFREMVLITLDFHCKYQPVNAV